tara:strand:+ start:5784 stop:6452 length:669 start_codon:yes stop_codon:yes gene_type:complete
MNKLNHIAFIMDGNGRWGKKKRRGRNFGHVKGVETVKKIVTASINFKVPIVSFYVFSSENWKRPKKEIFFLFKLIENYFARELKNIISQGIKINILGEMKKLPLEIKKILKKTINETKKNKRIIVNLAINYGSKAEILNAIKKNNKTINQENLQKNFYTKNMPNPDILIRTGGHQRLSNFMLWQLAYAELYFLKKLWPDFQRSDLKKIITDFKKIKRNFGAI